ncbi:MAG: rubrerythrin [Clostridium sp.]
MNLNGTKTEGNLKAAFAGESQARNKYTYYACKAREEGYEQIADIFEETAHNEMSHARLWFKFLNNESIPSTEENLKDAAGGENYEHTDMYKQFADDAKAEGFDKIALLFEAVGKIEHEHEQRYLKLLENLKNDKIFKKEEKTTWICRECGYIYVGEQAPNTCPVCKYPKAFFEVKSDNF